MNISLVYEASFKKQKYIRVKSLNLKHTHQSLNNRNFYDKTLRGVLVITILIRIENGVISIANLATIGQCVTLEHQSHEFANLLNSIRVSVLILPASERVPNWFLVPSNVFY